MSFIFKLNRISFYGIRLCSNMPAIASPPKSLLKPINVPKKLLMGPGPSNGPRRVLEAGSLPVLGHLHEEFIEIMDTVKDGIRYLFQTNTKYALAVSGTGHTAMEAAVSNLVETNDIVLVAVNGIWGDRFGDMVERHDGCVKKIEKNIGEVFSLEEIKSALDKYRPKLMFITHGESSGGTCQPLEGIGSLCHSYDCLLIVDSVAAAGGVPLYMDDWQIDYLYSGSQKVLGVPPGSSPIAFTEAARKMMQNRRKAVRSFCLDMNWLTNYWNCNGETRKYHHTAPINTIYQLREGLALLAEEGLEQSWLRHSQCVQHLHNGLEGMGLRLVVNEKFARLACVTTVYVPKGINPKTLIKHAMDRYRVEISGGLGSLTGKVWRIGLMGENATINNVNLVLKIFREGLELKDEHLKSAL